MRRSPALLLVVMVLVSGVGFGTSSQFTPVSAQANCRVFNATGHALCDRFLQYWEEHGGLAQQGYPISEPFRELSDIDGKIYTVQYFERAVFELHPEYRTPNDVLLTLLGTFSYKEKYPNGAPRQVSNMLAGSQFFPQTGKRLGSAFLTYWQSHGGLAQQGYPVSDEFLETSTTDGKVYKMQYFERAVFEAHPEKAAPYNVLLSLLGTFRLRGKYGDGSSLPSPPGFISGGLGLSRAEWERIHGPGGEGMFDTPPNKDGYNIAYISVGSNELTGAISKVYDPNVSIAEARLESKRLLPADAQIVTLNEIDGEGNRIFETYDTYLSQSLATLVPPGTPNQLFAEANGPDIWNDAQPGTITIKYDPYNYGSNVVYMLIYIGGRNR